MSAKTFLRLIVALAVLSGLAYWLNRPQGKVVVEGVSAGDPVLGGLDVNAITRLEIASGVATTRLARTDKGWVSETWFGYPARFDRIAGTLRTLSDLEVGQVLRDGVRSPAEFGLDPAANIADYHRITLSGSDGAARVVELGNLKQMRDAAETGMGIPTGRFLRSGDGPVVLVEETLTSVQAAPGEWVERRLLSLAADAIASVAIVGTNDEFTIRRNEENQFTLGRIEEGTQVDQSAVLRVLQAFQALQFEGIQDPSLAEEASGMTGPESVTVRTQDAMTYEVRFGAAPVAGAARPVRIAVAWKPEEAAASDEEKTAKEQQAAALNATFSGWTYLVPDGLAGQILVSRSNLVTRPSTPPVAPETEAAPTPPPAL